MARQKGAIAPVRWELNRDTLPWRPTEDRQLETRYLIIVRRWLWLIVLATLVAVLVTYVATRNQPTLYEAKTRLLVGPGIDALNPDLNAMRAGARLMQTYAELVHTEPFLHNVRNELGLALRPEELADRITVRLNQETQIITVHVQDENPLRAALIAYTVGEHLVALSPAAAGNAEVTWYDQMRRQAAILENERVEIESALLQLEVQSNATLDLEAQQQIRAEISQERGRLLEVHRMLTGMYEALQTSNSNQVTLIEPVGNVTPVPDQRALQLLLGAVTGLALSLALVVTLAYLSDTVESPQDLAQMTNVPVIAAIPPHNHFLSATYRPLVAHSAPNSAAAESYQVLAAKLLYAGELRLLRTILCSGLPGSEQAAELLANLGLVMAQAGRRVIVVDANLRQPLLSELFGVAERPGLTEVLTGRTPAVKVTPLSWAPGLSVVTAGQMVERAFTYLASSRMDDLLMQLQSQADKVLVLGPPLIAYGDSLFLAAQMEGVLLVANRKRTRFAELNEAISGLYGIGANVIGTVLKNSDGYVAYTGQAPERPAPIALPKPSAQLSSSTNGREGAQEPVKVDETRA
jgi:predicted ribosomally synthesized peptide with SipW-like signal peptide